MTYAEVEADVSSRFPLSGSQKADPLARARSSWAGTSYSDYLLPRPHQPQTSESKLSGNDQVDSLGASSYGYNPLEAINTWLNSSVIEDKISQIEEASYTHGRKQSPSTTFPHAAIPTASSPCHRCRQCAAASIDPEHQDSKPETFVIIKD